MYLDEDWQCWSTVMSLCMVTEELNGSKSQQLLLAQSNHFLGLHRMDCAVRQVVFHLDARILVVVLLILTLSPRVPWFLTFQGHQHIHKDHPSEYVDMVHKQDERHHSEFLRICR
jgi:hypothetical protein